MPLVAPLAPVFSQHFEYRNTGPAPFSGHAEATAAGWIRAKTAPPRMDSAVRGQAARHLVAGDARDADGAPARPSP